MKGVKAGSQHFRSFFSDMIIQGVGYERLAEAVIIQAVEDYKKCDKWGKIALDKWFTSPYGCTMADYAGLDPDFVIESIRRWNDEKTTKKDR